MIRKTALLLAAAVMLGSVGCKTTVVEPTKTVEVPAPDHHDDHHPPPPPPDHRDDRHDDHR